jgi:mono/diheme cytochrome c family protein
MKRPLIVFGIFALVLGIGIPYLAIRDHGAKKESVAEVPASMKEGQELFQRNCGACHTLERGGTDGVVGPNLDDLLGTSAPDARKTRVENAIKNGGTGVGKMPANIVDGRDREVVAGFVAKAAKTAALP